MGVLFVVVLAEACGGERTVFITDRFRLDVLFCYLLVKRVSKLFYISNLFFDV